MHYHLYVARRERRLKQKHVADFLKIHSATYNRKENGVAEFTLSEAFALAGYFGSTVDELFREVGAAYGSERSGVPIEV